MGAQIETLAEWVAETPGDAIPAAVRQHAKRVLLDTFGVILAGSQQPEVSGLQQRLLANGGSGATVFTAGWPVSSPHTAALLNGTAGRSIELCEGHRYVSCQGAVQVLPAVLAVGESANRSGSDLLTALILGYEVAVRIGSGVTARSIAHQNGQAPLLGAVAAGAKLRGLNAADTSRALRLGATLLLTPSYTNAVAGATVLNVAGGMSGFAGTLAPDLALAGFAAQENAIEEAFGRLVGDGFEPEGILDELGQRWEISRNYFRLRACCNPIYAALDALEAALAEWRPTPDAIDRIEVETYRFASVMQAQQPANTFAARYSFPHAAAAIITHGHAGHMAFTESVVHDPAIADLRQRVHMREDTDLSLMAPRLKPARVTITLKDGRRSTGRCESPRGDFQNPYPESEIRGKFRQLAALVLSPDGVAAVEAAVDRCEQWSSLNELTDLLRRHGRSEAS